MTLTIPLEYQENNLYLEVEYTAWAEESSNHYDVPSDPSEFEIEKVTLHDGKSAIDITLICDDLSRVTKWDSLQTAIENHLNSYK
tara:strand:+ start:373 stop:627 length:255 start_codon:yes stop_codon:yes gene_type:complete